MVETDFIKYSGTFRDNIQGTVDANFSKYSIKLQGEDSSKLQSSFGSLKKEEIDMQKLLQDSKDKLVHNLPGVTCKVVSNTLNITCRSAC